MPSCRALATAIVSNDQAAVRQLLATYNRGMATTSDDAWAIEAEVHQAWNRRQAAESGSKARLDAVIDRGRSQLSAQPTD